MRVLSSSLPRSVALAACLAAALPASAQTRLSPGLWEQSITIKAGNAQTDDAMAKMQEKLASMPPEQRKMVEQMMASRGVGIGANASPNTMRLCLSKEQVERDAPPPPNAQCAQQDVTRTGNVVKTKFSCQGATPVSGTAEFTIDSPTSYAGHTVTDTVVQGKPAHMQTDIAARWLGADCGAIKPAASAK